MHGSAPGRLELLARGRSHERRIHWGGEGEKQDTTLRAAQWRGTRVSTTSHGWARATLTDPARVVVGPGCRAALVMNPSSNVHVATRRVAPHSFPLARAACSVTPASSLGGRCVRAPVRAPRAPRGATFPLLPTDDDTMTMYPPVSQICALTVLPSTLMLLVANSTPIVDLDSRLNSLRVKRERTGWCQLSVVLWWLVV